MAELESKIASYAEAAAQADMRFQAIEEKLRRENEALRKLLTSSGLDPNVLEYDDITVGHQEGTLQEMQTSTTLAEDTVPSVLESYMGSRPLQSPKVSKTVHCVNESCQILYSVARTNKTYVRLSPAPDLLRQNLELEILDLCCP